MNDENWEKELEELEQKTRNHPENVEAWNARIIALWNHERKEDSLNVCNEAVRENPESEEAHKLKTSILGNLGRYEEALVACEAWLVLKPESEEAHKLKTRILGSLGRYEEALESCEAWLVLKPESEEAQGLKTSILGNLGRYEEALVACEAWLVLKPESEEAHKLKTDILVDLGRREEALVACEAWLVLKPELEEAHKLKTGILYRFERYEEALESCEAWLVLNPESEEAQGLKTSILGNLGRYEEALVACEAWLGRNPESEEAHKLKTLILGGLGRYEETLESCEAWLGRNPESEEAHKLKTLILVSFERYEKTLESCEAWLDLNPESEEAHKLKTRILGNLGRYKEGLIECSQVIRINPQSDEIYPLWASLLIDLKQYKEAFTKSRQGIRINPKNEDNYFLRDLALSHDGRQMKVLDLFCAAIKDDPDNSLLKNNRMKILGNDVFWANITDKCCRRLWEHDDDYQALVDETRLNCRKADLERLHQLWGEQYKLLHLLRVQDIERVGHYTSTDVFDTMLQEPLKMCSLIATNDPTEGMVFQNFLDDSLCMPAARKSKLAVLQASFSWAIDSLNQFRLYGKKEGKEGTGVCLVFNRDFFASPDDRMQPILNTGAVWKDRLPGKDEPQKKDDKAQKDERQKMLLYWVLYYDQTSRRVYYTPANTSDWVDAGEDFQVKDTRIKIQHYTERLGEIGASLQKIQSTFKAIKSADVKGKALEMLVYLRHLIKDAAFMDEKELRILSLHRYDEGHDLNVLKNKKCLSRDYLPILHEEGYLKQVIIGPKVENCMNLVEVWTYEMGKKQVRNVEFLPSRTPLH